MRFFPTKEETDMLFIGNVYSRMNARQKSEYKREMINVKKMSSPQFDLHVSKCVYLAEVFNNRPMWAHYVTVAYFKFQSFKSKIKSSLLKLKLIKG